MDPFDDHSDPDQSQPTQLIEFALAAPTEHVEYSREQTHSVHDKQQSNDHITGDFSADSIVPPRRETVTRYQLCDQPVSTDQNKGGKRGPSEWGSQKEATGSKDNKDYQCNTNPVGARAPPHDAPKTSLSVKVTNSDVFNPSVPFTASGTGKVNGKRAVSFEPPILKTTKPQSLAHPTKSMPPIPNRYRRSPSPASQDSFGGPVSQDPEAQYLATTKEFYVPLSALGGSPTQEVIHDDVDHEPPLSDTSEHQAFLDAAMADYEARNTGRPVSSNVTGRVLVAATPSESAASFSGAYSHRNKDQFLKTGAAEQDSQESTQPFDFDQTASSLDRMLDKEVEARTMKLPPELLPTQPTASGSTPDNTSLRAEPPTFRAPDEQSKQRQRSQTPQWISPTPDAVVASSNPRSLLRLVNPMNKYRIAKLRQMHGDVAPPSYVGNSAIAETQPSRIEATQPSTQAQPGSSCANNADRQAKGRRVNTDKEVDPIDMVPDSEPLRVGHSAPSSADDRRERRASLPQNLTIDHPPCNVALDSSEVGEPSSEDDDDADVPLSSKLSAKVAGKAPAMQAKAQTRNSRKPKSAPAVTNTARTAPKIAEDRAKAPKGKVPTRRKSNSKKESVIPSSVPQQDLPDIGSPPGHPPTTSSRAPTSKKQRARQPPAASRARPASTGNKIAKRKRLISDTESTDGWVSEDGVVATSPEIAKREEKEEEERIEAACDYDADVVPPIAGPKAGPAHKRRRLEDAKPSGVSSRSTSTHRNSSTPVPGTRSVKRLRSGMSTIRASAEPATRVFALWKQDGHFYSGTVHSAITGRGNPKYLVKFDDGTDDEVELKNLRRCELRVGDNVILMSNGARAKVSDISEVESRGVLEVKIDDGESVVISDVEFRDIRIASRTLHAQWKDRTLDSGAIVPAVKPKLLADIATPSKQSLASLSGRNRELGKTGFVVTLSVKNMDPDQTKDDTMAAIKQYGGQIVDEWSSVFTMEGHHSQSSKRWTVTPEDFRLREDVNLDRVFLLSDDANQKPKFLIALALGIPCLSFEWLTQSSKPSQDWQPHLLPAGYSDALGARVSQMIDLDWGNCSEYLQDILSNRVAPKLFANKTFLCVDVDFVPPPRGRKNASNIDRGREATRAVPWIILCMGASRVEAVTDIKLVPSKELQKFDYIIVKDPAGMEDSEEMKVASVNWVKECLISSRIIPRDWTQS